MASQDQNQVCRFSEIEAEHSYPPRFKKCEGSLVRIQQCNEDIDPNYGERYIILVRSGYINRYSGFEKWYICENHRKMFGRGFKGDFVQKQKKCKYPEHEYGQLSKHNSLKDHS